jgi:hypothetical protein
MRFVGTVSLITGWFGAVWIGVIVGGRLGELATLVLIFMVAAAHNWIATGRL